MEVESGSGDSRGVSIDVVFGGVHPRCDLGVARARIEVFDDRRQRSTREGRLERAGRPHRLDLGFEGCPLVRFRT